MKSNGGLVSKIDGGEFILTAECLPKATVSGGDVEAVIKSLGGKIAAVNIADNPYGVVMSSLAASIAAAKAGVEPIFQLVTRDRNRMALQSDLLGAASLGIANVLCLSGYHQVLTDCPESANVYDIDSIQLVELVKTMTDKGQLLDGKAIEGDFSMVPGAAASPYMRPLELNIIRVVKKVEAGARFIQTQAVFDLEAFKEWLDAATEAGISDKAAILAGVLVLHSADEAKRLRETFTEFVIGDDVVARLEGAGDAAAQAREGVAIAAGIIGKIKDMKGVRGIHLISGGNEGMVPEVIAAAGL